MRRAIKSHPHHLRDAARVVAISLIDLRLQHRPHMARLNTDHRQICFGERTEEPLRQRSSFQSNPLETVSGIRQYRQQSVGFARDLHFSPDPARVIHNADARVLDRNVESYKIIHAALLLLMLEAASTDLGFTISLKRSTSKSSAIHKNAGRLPHLITQSGHPDLARHLPTANHKLLPMV